LRFEDVKVFFTMKSIVCE